MREESCNSFICEGLAEIERHVATTTSNRFFVVAMAGNGLVGAAFVEGKFVHAQLPMIAHRHDACEKQQVLEWELA
jgi:hypothetical protein